MCSNLWRKVLISESLHLDVWHDRNISAGSEWEQEITKHLNEANIILLLISSNFMDSDYCYGFEMQQAIRIHNAKKARVIPIILRPSDWHEAPFGKLQVLPTNGKPVTTWRNRDEAFLDINKGIRKALEEITYVNKVKDYPFSLVHCRRFCQIAGLVDVVTTVEGYGDRWRVGGR